MLERTTRSYLEDILSKDFTYLKKQDLIPLESKRSLRHKLRNSNSTPNDVCCSPDERIMTRKTRTRRPRIPAIQSGYCAVCNLPYNSVEDHIQSKKHLKLIGEDANYIALNGFLHTSSIPFLNLNGIDAIGVHETSLEDFSPKYRRRNMPRTRAASVMCDRLVKPSPLSPTGSDSTGHHLRSRRNINYMTPPLDDDSLQEDPDIGLPEKREIEPPHHEYKEYRELRSSTRALAKLTEPVPDNHEEVWNSGRPKRACIKQKRISADERLVADNKTYYKVEVLSSKLRSSTHHAKEHDRSRRHHSQSPRREEEEKDKGLIVKFKKLRNSELVQLNNEATNFLFPKKDDDSSEDEDVDADGANTTVSSGGKNDSTLLLSSDTEDSASQKFKVEDEASMDSMCSETKRKKRRRTHAEAFIMDNQKYYKFETPGSRLRYHGTYLPSVAKSPDRNGDYAPKVEKVEKTDGPEEKTIKLGKNPKLQLSNYKFAFEKIPQNAPWYNTFQRQDRGEQAYSFFSDEYFWDPFILPYQMPCIAPLDPKICMNHYSQLIKCLCEPSSDLESGCSTPEPSMSNSMSSLYEPDLDEDSKMSATTVSSSCSLDEIKPMERKRRGRPRLALQQQQPGGSGKNPRKSPRQHASTLAILSSLIQQRRRRSRNKVFEELSQSLPTIPEEESNTTQEQQDTPKQQQQQQQQPQAKPKIIPYGRFRPKIDYFSIARQIDDELDTALDGDLEEYELEVAEENTVDFHNSKMNVEDILRLYEEGKSKEDERSCRRFFNGTPGRKPGRRKKKNKTGWPNKNRRLVKKGQEKEKEDDNDDSTIDSMSVNMDSEEEICEEDANSTDSIKKVNLKNSANKSDQALSEVNKEENCDVDRVDRIDLNDKVLTNKVTNSADFQPYVCVQKLDSDKLLSKQTSTPKRTNRRQRRMPGSPKSPRMLRKPRGRWYRER